MENVERDYDDDDGDGCGKIKQVPCEEENGMVGKRELVLRTGNVMNGDRTKMER